MTNLATLAPLIILLGAVATLTRRHIVAQRLEMYLAQQQPPVVADDPASPTRVVTFLPDRTSE